MKVEVSYEFGKSENFETTFDEGQDAFSLRSLIKGVLEETLVEVEVEVKTESKPR